MGLSSRLNKMSENLTRNTNMIGNSKVKLEEVVNSLAALQSNYSGAFAGMPGNITSINNSAHNASILEELNATRSELIKIRESQLAISALVETQGQLLVEQIARLDKLEEKINANSTYNITNAETTNNSSNLSTSIQNNT